MAKIAVYLRVSTSEQNLDGQRTEVLAWLHQQGLTADGVRWFADKETGKTLMRREFQRLQNAIAAGEIDTVVVQRLDRVSRKLREGLNCIVDWVEKGVRLVAVKQQIDLNGAVGRLIAAVLLGVAEMENELRRERQMAGIREAKRLGKYLGGTAGWRKGSPERVAELVAMGLKASEIARSLGISVRSVQRYHKEHWRKRNKIAVAKAAAALNGESNDVAGSSAGTHPVSASGVPGHCGGDNA